MVFAIQHLLQMYIALFMDYLWKDAKGAVLPDRRWDKRSTLGFFWIVSHSKFFIHLKMLVSFFTQYVFEVGITPIPQIGKKVHYGLASHSEVFRTFHPN